MLLMPPFSASLAGQEAQVQAAALFNYRGLTFDYLDNKDKALADYTQAIQLDPNSAHAYNNRGNAYNVQGKYDL